MSRSMKKAASAADSALGDEGSDVQAVFAILAQLTTDLIVRGDRAGRITYISPAVRNFGFEPEELIGRSGRELIHPDDEPKFSLNVAALLRGERDRTAQREYRFRRTDGSWAWVESNPHLEYDADGSVRGFVTIFRDITERRAQAELFEAAFEHAGIGKSLVSLDGTVFKVNRTLCDMLGYSQAELTGMTTETLIHPDQFRRSLADTQRMVAGEIESYEAERQFRRADGTYVWLQLFVALVRHPDGSPKHYVSQVQDLTERHAAEAALLASEARYRLIAENMSDMIFVTDLEGRSTYVSPSVRRYGVKPDEVVGRAATESVHPEDMPRMREAFTRLAQGGSGGRVRWRGRDGKDARWNWLESSPTLLRDPETGEPTGFLDVVRDVTKQVEQEAALAQARAAAEAAAAAKTQFLANMSHEIRTPLTAVLGFTNLLREMELPEAATGYVRRIAGAGNGLLAIVNDILDFSKLEAGKFEIRPRPTPVAEVCEETLQLFSTQADAKGLTLEFEVRGPLPRTVMIDGDRLRQMLVNLIGNAVKFTETGGVTVTVGPSAPDAIRIEIIDTGPGLDPDAQRRLFQRFTQVDDSMTRAHGGTGLGLAICRGLAEAMGGSVAVTSTLGSGAAFSLDLPAPAAAVIEALDDEQEAISIDGIRVLVVDDNPVNRELSRRILAAAGADVTDAPDGEEALSRLSLLPVDVVLMDLRMPQLDGRGALRRLRAEPGPNQDVPVLAFTADADLEGGGDLDGFDGLVRKPIQPLEMYAAIATATRWLDEDEEATHAAG